jgi:hypothetical protein
VRGRLALRSVLTGAALGLALATIPALIAWKTRHGELRRWAPAVGLVGAAVGFIASRRRRWSDAEVALFLDERLATDEAITTAVEQDDHAVVLSIATRALGDSRGTKRVGPVLFRPVHLVAPIAAAALVVIARAPLPPAPLASAPPGSAIVRLRDVESLEKVAELGNAEARDPAQKERLDRIAKDAEKLRQDLQRGLEKREAQDRLAHLRDQIAAERLSLGDGERRAGLESAVSKLEESDATKGAARALGDHDLAAMDAEMERLANQREKQDRELAKKQLEDAAEAARKNGAQDVAKALEEEKKLTGERGNRADLLKDLAKAMDGSGTESDEVKRDADAFGKSGRDKDAEKLADAMGKALEKLSPEERKRLADKLRDQMKSGGGGAGDQQDLKDLADELSTPEGQKKLEQELKDLAGDDTEGSESKRQHGLDDAEKGTDDAEGDIDGEGQGKGGESGKGQPGEQDGTGEGHGEQGSGDGAGSGHVPIPIPMNGSGGNAQGSGGSHDVGGGDHGAGSHGPVDADTLRSRAHGRLNKGSAMPGTVTGLVPGHAGGTANVRGTGELRTVGPHEVDGVDHSDVPEEYREQVRQYFQP